nr:hypothetical protein BaRGS_012031 [Batillaria attramentaria]
MDEKPETFIEAAVIDNADYQDENDIIVPARINPRLANGVIVAVLMVVGLVGNSLVLYVYNFKMPRTVFSFFVTVLALLDLTTTLCGMPIDVVIKTVLLSDTLSMNVICKIAHLENYGTSLTSGSVLLLIAATRYRKVCQPLEPSISRRWARIMCGIIFTVAMVLCSVTLIINGPESVKIAMGQTDVLVASQNNTGLSQNTSHSMNAREKQEKNDSMLTVQKREVVEVNICRTSQEYKGTVLYYVLYSILSMAFVSILLSLIILHCRISRTVKRFQQRQSRMRSCSIYSDDSHYTDNINSKMFRIFASITLGRIPRFLS